MEKCRCTVQAEGYLSIINHYDDISRRTRAIARLLDVIHSNRENMDTFPNVEDVCAAFGQIDENLDDMDSLVNDMLQEIKRQRPAKLRAVAG